ncbi:MAG: GAF domain-containing protein [Thermoplasmatales archaeon]|nr:MAG: GAF domain-containing protein [Thermoplasmatales archaeon]
MDYDIAEQKIKKIISESDPSHLLQNCLEFLYEKFAKYSWIGIYLVKGNNLILGPWKGMHPTEHTKIPIGKGICGAAAKTGKTELVTDVSTDNRYLSCFASTRSEIVVPIKKNDKIIGEIDIDSDITDAFDTQDAVFLEKIANMLSKHI